MACASLFTPAHATHVGEDLVADEQTVAANDQLLVVLRQFENAPPAVREARTAQLVQLAQQRKARLLQLIERNPRVAALRLLPAGVRERLPAAARVHIEDSLRITGAVFAEVADDFDRGVSSRRFFMQGSDGARYGLAMADAAGSERDLLSWSGRRMSLQVTRLGNQLLVGDKQTAQLVAADGTTTAATTITTPTAVSGSQKTLVVLLNFADKAAGCTQSDLSNRLFGTSGQTVNNNYLESSRGAVSFAGTVTPPLSINYSVGGSCSYMEWANAADAAARAAGYDPANYQRVSYVIPSGSGCGWSGLAYMPGKQSWVAACSATGVFSHELGHNLALHHAATPTSEYGDGSDPMGGASVVRHNGANQALAGWLPAGAYAAVASAGSYALGALGVAGNTAPQVLRLNKPDTGEYYYVSLRQAVGLDSNLLSTYLNRVSIHRAGSGLPAKTFLMQTLDVGQTFTDATNGISITLQGLAGSVATVGVNMAGGTCTRSAPTVTVSPATQMGMAGSTLQYTMTVRNNNSSVCGAGSFNLAQTMPAGVSAALSPLSLSVAAGGSASASLSVQVPGSGSGTYTFDLRATDASASTSTAVAHGSFNVGSSDTTPPGLSSFLPADGADVFGRIMTLSVTASDAGSGVRAVEFYVNGSLVTSDTSAPYSANVNLRKLPRDAPATLTVKAYDNAGNMSAVTHVVNIRR